MIEVSEAYKEAVAAAVRTEKISGYIKFKHSGEKLQVTDENTVQGSLSLDEEICSGKFRLGTFNTTQLKIAVYDEEAMEHDFTNASIVLKYGLKLASGEYQYIPLGRYNADGTLMKRRRDRVYLTAFDNSIRFDRKKPPENKISNIKAYTALKRLCSASGVSFALTQEEVEALPNAYVKISLTDPQLQTNRDCVMWIAALLGCYARINRSGNLEIKRVDYVSDEETHEIFPEWTITGDERKKTIFSDTRTYAKYVTAYSAGKVKLYDARILAVDNQAVQGTVTLPQNPLVKGLSEEEADIINQNICDDTARFLQRGIETDTIGNPAIECGDTIELVGGAIDVRRHIIGLVTRRTWRYRQNDKLICQMHDVWTPVDDEEEITPTGFSVLSENEGEDEIPEEEYIYVTPKSQTEKRIDALCKSIEEVKAENTAANGYSALSFFGLTENGGCKINNAEYSWETDENGYVSLISDDSGNTFAPDLTNVSVLSAELFNSYLLATVFSRGIGKESGGNGGGTEEPETTITIGGVEFDILDKGTEIKGLINNNYNIYSFHITVFIPFFNHEGSIYILKGSTSWGLTPKYFPYDVGITADSLSVYFFDNAGYGGSNRKWTAYSGCSHGVDIRDFSKMFLNISAEDGNIYLRYNEGGERIEFQNKYYNPVKGIMETIEQIGLTAEQVQEKLKFIYIPLAFPNYGSNAQGGTWASWFINQINSQYN